MNDILIVFLKFGLPFHPSIKFEKLNFIESFVSVTFYVTTEPSFTTKSLINSMSFKLPRDQFDFHWIRCKIKKFIIFRSYRELISIHIYLR